MWFKVDGSIAFHPKVHAAGNAAMGLWLRAGAWSSEHATGGCIPSGMLAAFGATRQVADTLVKAGLWDKDADGWRFHDWTDYQPDAYDAAAARDAQREGAREANHRRWHAARGIRKPGCRYCFTDQSSDH
jgi:hypothetical protein